MLKCICKLGNKLISGKTGDECGEALGQNRIILQRSIKTKEDCFEIPVFIFATEFS